MSGVILPALVGALVGAVVTALVMRRAARRARPPVPVTAQRSLTAAVARARYEIQRNGATYWHGDDAQLAKQWWEAARQEPGALTLAFLEGDVVRDTVQRAR